MYYLYWAYEKYLVFCEFFYKLKYLRPRFEVSPQAQYSVATAVSTEVPVMRKRSIGIGNAAKINHTQTFILIMPRSSPRQNDFDACQNRY
jgi:hypothetical protein